MEPPLLPDLERNGAGVRDVGAVRHPFETKFHIPHRIDEEREPGATDCEQSPICPPAAGPAP